ncbi:MAG: CPBP family intramembrane metalloprotease [Paludibacteraceae bacterium]|nr:CPBP family intramembrane metalloprotease [Paludibacteraceae bacterium]
MENKLLPILLPVRSVKFLFVFLAGALITETDVERLGRWWSIIAVVVNILTIMLLVYVAHKSNLTFGQLINYQRGATGWTSVLLITLIILFIGMAGMYLAGFLCYNNFLYAPSVIIAPIPKWIAIINILLLPISTVFAEDGLYLGCGVNQIKNKYTAILVPAFFYAFQHCFIPFLVDGRYILYRFLSFLPLTIILCAYYYKRRNPVPVMIGHAVIDLATAIQILATSLIPGLYETMCGI